MRPAFGLTSGPSTLKRDQIAERGARVARRDDREYREYWREEQRSQAGCPAREVVLLPRGRATSVVAWLLLARALPVGAQPLPPKLTAPVNDFAHVIDSASARELDRRIRTLQAASGDVVVVATVPTYQPYGDIKEYAVKMFENGGSGIGARGKDNGALIVVAVEDRKVGIEVGYSLEEYITDGFAGQTIREAMLPEFRSGNYGRGLVAGATRIINRIADARGVNLQDVPREAPRPQPAVRVPIGAIVFILFLILMATRRRSRRRRYWGGPWSGWNSGVGPFGGGFGGGFGGFGGGGGGGGGGFGGFGGGRSGGGGASGGW